MTDYNNKNMMIENHLGRFSLKQIKETAYKTSAFDKIEKWTRELVSCFPEFQSEIKTYMPLLLQSQDKYVLESLLYADSNLSFCENKDHDGFGMKYKYNMNCIQISRSFLKEMFGQESKLYGAALFLSKTIHELTHAAQDMRGVAPLRVSKMNLANAVTAELMTEVDASIVEMHLQYELTARQLQQAPEWIKDTDLGFYADLMRQCETYREQKLTPAQQHRLADMTLMRLFLDYKESVRQNNEWQEIYFRQMVQHLLCRPVHSLTIDDTPGESERYLMTYYQKRYPLLQSVQKKLMTVLPIRPIEQAVLIGNSFPKSTPAVYGDVHQAKMTLLTHRQQVSAYHIYLLVRQQNQR